VAGASDRHLQLEIVTALGRLHASSELDVLVEFASDEWPAVRAAALTAIAQADPDAFLSALSGLDPDPHWSVRAAIAPMLADLPPELGAARLRSLLADQDARVLPAALSALARLKPPDAEGILRRYLEHSDPVVRLAAVNGWASLDPPDLAARLATAYRAWMNDATYVARAAALAALAKSRDPAAAAALQDALRDPEWPVRRRAASLLAAIRPDPSLADRIRPSAASLPAEEYYSAELTAPPVSPHVFIDTDKGVIEIELAVLDAPLTARNFIALARKGFFNNTPIHRVVPNFVVQDGDPRGDGEGGPGYTIRDELNQAPYLRGAVGMALDWEDTGGSQFFITLSPQPHLDARYTLFARVVSGMEVVDRLQQWDVISRVRVWDGVTMSDGGR
jgi:cyclophilin family peptidyl-prolyl cis-trans isomerase